MTDEDEGQATYLIAIANEASGFHRADIYIVVGIELAERSCLMQFEQNRWQSTAKRVQQTAATVESDAHPFDVVLTATGRRFLRGGRGRAVP